MQHHAATKHNDTSHSSPFTLTDSRPHFPSSPLVTSLASLDSLQSSLESIKVTSVASDVPDKNKIKVDEGETKTDSTTDALDLPPRVKLCKYRTDKERHCRELQEHFQAHLDMVLQTTSEMPYYLIEQLLLDLRLPTSLSLEEVEHKYNSAVQRKDERTNSDWSPMNPILSASGSESLTSITFCLMPAMISSVEIEPAFSTIISTERLPST